MTKTERWLAERRTVLHRGEALGGGLFLAGVLLATLGVGVLAGHLGLYEWLPPLVVGGWVAVLAIGGWAARRWRRRARRIDGRALAGEVESVGGLRRGSVLGVSEPATHGSSALFDAADRQVRTWLDTHGDEAMEPAHARNRRAVRQSAGLAVIGVVVFVTAGPMTGRGASFWRPDSVLAAAISTVSIDVSQTDVRRGDSVVVTVTAKGRGAARLLTRAPGEPWRDRSLTLDSGGTARVTLGPLDADRFVKATHGRRTSREVHVRVAIPAFLAELSLHARFPGYLERADEPLLDGDSVLLPMGTRLLINARATVPVGLARWVRPGQDDVPLQATDSRIEGEGSVTASGSWTLVVAPLQGGPPVEDTPLLFITAVPDSAPVVTVPVPGVDTVVPTSLRLPLVTDARDDHGLSLVTLRSWRGDREVGTEQVDTLFVPETTADRAMLSWVLDLNERGFHSGDTAFYQVTARDNSPRGQRAHSPVYALRLPSVAEMRNAIRDAARQMAEQADSLARSQDALARETERLADAEAREPNADGLDFESAERAAEVSQEQQALLDRAEEMAEQLRELSEASWDAEMTDAEWHEQLAQLQELLEKAMTPEMAQAMDDLQSAIENLDPEEVKRALEELAEQQRQLEEQLERSRELMERAALEGALSTLADDAEELTDRQDEWNQQAAQDQVTDSALAAGEQQLIDQADRLQQDMQQVRESLEDAGQPQRMDQSQQAMQQAMQQMNQAQQQAQRGQTEQAQQSGEQASQQLNPMSDDLRQQLEELREQWRDEVLRQMDQAMAETADLAERQENLSRRMERGETGAEIRGAQAAVRESVDRVIQRLQDAAGQNALVSPQLSTALGFSRLKMSEALEQFEQATPNTRQAAEMAAQAVDGLNAVAAALLRNRGDVENSESGSGMAEAMAQMAEMAAQQDALNGETGGMMPLMPQGGEQLIQQLQDLAQRQQALGEQLEEMAAEEGLPGATDEMADEAMEIAEELAAGRLDRETLERQEQLFRRLLDAGRSLRSDEEDEQKDRESVTADQTNVQPPAALDPSVRNRGVRYPYPTWEQLRGFSPEERRVILDYFRRLNAGRP